MVRTESSPIARLSTRAIALADRLSYAGWIFSVPHETTPTALSAHSPSEYELELTALKPPSVTFVAESGSPERAFRARPEIGRTVQRDFGLCLVVSGLAVPRFGGQFDDAA